MPRPLFRFSSTRSAVHVGQRRVPARSRDDRVVGDRASSACRRSPARERDGLLGDSAAAAAIERLDVLGAAWLEMHPSAPLRRTAMRLLRVHPLRAADALQLAAAIAAAARGRVAVWAFVTLDDRLAQAAVSRRLRDRRYSALLTATGGYTRGSRTGQTRQEGSVAQAAPRAGAGRPRRRPGRSRPRAPTAARRGRRPDQRRRPARADPQDPRDPDPARPELLGPRAGRPDGRRPRRPRGLPEQQDPGLRRRPRRAPADPRGPCLQPRPARRLHHPPRARGPGPATSPSTSPSSSRTWPAPTSATARPGATGEHRPLQRDLRVPGGGCRDRGRQARRRPRQLSRRARAIPRPPSTSWSRWSA